MYICENYQAGKKQWRNQNIWGRVYSPTTGKITLQEKMALLFPPPFQYFFSVIMNKLLPTMFCNDSWRVLIGYSNIRTLVLPLLGSLKKRSALLFIANSFFPTVSTFICYWVTVFGGNLFHKLVFVVLTIAMSVKDWLFLVYTGSAWHWLVTGFIPKIYRKAAKIHKELWLSQILQP